MPPPVYMPPPQPIYVATPAYSVSNKNTGALIAEVILNLFSIYGVGWLMAGETAVGTTLLICTAFYWLIAIVVIIFTIGFGVICLAPLEIAFLITNILLLNNALNRKASQFIVVPQQQMPPR